LLIKYARVYINVYINRLKIKNIVSFTKKKRKSKGKKKTPCTHAFLSHCFSISFAIILTIQRELIYPSFNEFNLSDKDDL